jgi:hypothetical protein
VRRFKFTQEVAGADKVDAFVDDHPPTHDIAVLEQKQRLGFGVGAENRSSVSSAAASPSPRVVRPSSSRRC